jgi:hypothetical protein
MKPVNAQTSFYRQEGRKIRLIGMHEIGQAVFCGGNTSPLELLAIVLNGSSNVLDARNFLSI